MKLASYAFAQYLEPEEVILRVFHKHPMVMVPGLLSLVFFGYALPIFLYVLFPNFILFFVLWLFISMVRLFYYVSTWYHDAILLTNVSIVDVSWAGFFKRSSMRLEYSMIEGVSCEINGFMRTVFDFGNVAVKSNSGGAPIILKDAMSPSKIERAIMTHQEKVFTNQNMTDANALKEILANLIKHHVANSGNDNISNN
ncbi:MAG TPA: hypothetical protein P5229_03675 [Candidatus Gracilibacteria bacterium]|nr:hypothetical protein [Candidatus Gracilibacteria bacterium]